MLIQNCLDWDKYYIKKESISIRFDTVVLMEGGRRDKAKTHVQCVVEIMEI